LSYEEFEGIRTISARWAVFLRVLQKDGIEASAHPARFRRETRVLYNQFETGHVYVSTFDEGLVASAASPPLRQRAELCVDRAVRGSLQARTAHLKCEIRPDANMCNVFVGDLQQRLWGDR
jgi:hypothetical protein